MSECHPSKEQILEGFLGNEALTDGISDACAKHLLEWCEAQVMGFTPTAGCTLVDYGQYIARQTRTMAQIIASIEDGDSPARLRLRLQRLTDDTAQQAHFLGLLEPPRSMHDYLHALCRIAASQSPY